MKQEIIVPSSLSEISLKKYQEFVKVSKDFEGQKNSFIDAKTVSIFCDIPLKNVGLIAKTSIDDIVEHINSLFNEQAKLIHRFKFNKSHSFKDLEFGFIPSLKDITLDEYADLDSYIVNWEDMHKAMAVMYRPITKTVGDSYDIQEYNGTDGYADAMQYAPLDIVMGARIFFYHLGMELSRITTISLVEEMKQDLRQGVSSIKGGVGINHFMPLLEATLQDLEKSENSELILP